MVLLGLLSCACFFFDSMATAVNIPKRKTVDVWVYDDATNPWDGKVVEVAADAQESLDAIQDFLITSTHRIRDNDNMDLASLASIETALYEHFYTLVELAKDAHHASTSATADRIFELNASMQELLTLVSLQRKSAGGGATTTDPYALSDAFLDMYDELVDAGYSSSAFDTWIQLAASEASPGAAYEAIASYMLFQPQVPTSLFPLDLSAALNMLDRAGTASATVLRTIIRLAVFQNETSSTADSLLRTHAATNFLARTVLAARLEANTTNGLATDSDPCEEAAAYYYTSAEDSVHDMVDAGGEKGTRTRLAPIGNPEAVHRLGEMHFFGDAQAGLPANPAEALRHFEEAAANGVAHSLANLGLMYANGMGVEANPERAVQYFQQAADQGNAFAGTGVNQNNSLAFYHFLIAANESDSRQAYFNLGIMHYKGLGTPRSCPLAVEAFRQVAWRAGHFDDALLSPELGHEAYTRRDYPRALLHYSIWALVGVPQAACNAGFLLDHVHTQPFDTTPPLQLAKSLYESAKADPEALRKLGHCHRDGWAHAEALYSAGMLYTTRGDWDKARQAWNVCRSHEFPTNIPCILPALALDMWTGLAWMWTSLHDVIVVYSI
ncbi:hypothetical protein DYB35_009795 [Aphanomyces astaci]|uniref:Uncharacterized protein n=2 Tax=Aphanomyces astaci TaxID=112090 RepID=A0A3R6WPS5_APHAT|nr:hypothetical protein DYB35_009795 [Aphanomyces astaci]